MYLLMNRLKLLNMGPSIREYLGLEYDFKVVTNDIQYFWPEEPLKVIWLNVSTMFKVPINEPK